jgi:hypothetical protein
MTSSSSCACYTLGILRCPKHGSSSSAVPAQGTQANADEKGVPASPPLRDREGPLSSKVLLPPSVVDLIAAGEAPEPVIAQGPTRLAKVGKVSQTDEQKTLLKRPTPGGLDLVTEIGFELHEKLQFWDQGGNPANKEYITAIESVIRTVIAEESPTDPTDWKKLALEANRAAIKAMNERDELRAQLAAKAPADTHFLRELLAHLNTADGGWKDTVYEARAMVEKALAVSRPVSEGEKS